MDARGYAVGNERRQPDAEVDVLAVFQLHRRPGSHLFTRQGHGQRCPATVRTVRFSICLGASSPPSTTRRTKMPGRCTVSGSISPGSTNRSTSAIEIVPAI